MVMRRAVLSDIHGNLEALEAVLADLLQRGVESMACLGDFVGYGASPNECVSALEPLVEAGVVGNHDLASTGRLRLGGFRSDAAVAARWTDERLTPEHRAWLTELPLTVVWHGIRLVHASPSDPDEWRYVLSVAEAIEEFHGFQERVCLIGHSHVAGAFVESKRRVAYVREPELAIDPDSRYLVNVGSVGQPRDGDWRAAYLIVDEDRSVLQHVRVEYDVDRAARRILDAGLPSFLAERLRWGE
jgi:diadenosine tetraphosphatase ApaH/serine/threonine PP2A family protein phosphatase